MIMKQGIVIFISIILFLGKYETPILAQTGRSCIYYGRSYPHGTIIGDYRCDNGRWIRIR